MEGNISLVLEDICVQEQTPDGISYEEIIQHIEEQIQHELNKNNNVNELLAREMHYALNHTLKSLRRIAEYYDIPCGRKKKAQLIEQVVAFESDEHNAALVLRRRILWFLVETIRKDKHLNKYIIFN